MDDLIGRSGKPFIAIRFHWFNSKKSVGLQLVSELKPWKRKIRHLILYSQIQGIL